MPERSTRSHTLAAVAILGGCAVGLPSLRQPAAMLAAAGASIGLLAVARSAGLTAADLGLSAETAPRGGAVAGGAMAVSASSYGALLRTRWSAAAFDDDRLPTSWRPAFAEAFAVIPVQTVWLEELGYRGVLPALIERDHGPGAADIASAALFGLSHVRPAVEFEHARRREEAGSTAAAVVGTVAATTVAGLALGWLRRRTGSLLAPIGVHWSLNAGGVLAGVSARRGPRGTAGSRCSG
jgi:membrane protease YdiL (CAAX protease family)